MDIERRAFGVFAQELDHWRPKSEGVGAVDLDTVKHVDVEPCSTSRNSIGRLLDDTRFRVWAPPEIASVACVE